MKQTTSAKEKNSVHVFDYKVAAWMIGVHALAFLGFWTFSWSNLFLMLALYFITGCLGITLCFHRLLSHRTFKVPKWLERTFAVCGVLAMEGGPGEWVGHHRMHHAFSDTPKDPHNAREGFWHSHMGWLFKKVDEFDNELYLKKFARDIYSDKFLMWLDQKRVQLSLQALLALSIFLLGGFGALIWGVFVRMVVLYHATWLVNSAAHIWGYQTHNVGDLAHNNWLVALVTFGEGWHNNHHAFGDVAPSGYRWWEFDLTFLVIRILVFFGLARDIKMPPSHVHYDSLVWMPKAVIRRDAAASASAA